MIFWRRFKIRENERGFRFRDSVFVEMLKPGIRWVSDFFFREQVDIVSVKETFIMHPALDEIVKANVLEGEAMVLDLKSDERAIVWIDGRFEDILEPGLYALWTMFRDVAVEVIDTKNVRFTHDKLAMFMRSAGAERLLDIARVETGYIGLFFKDGAFVEALEPGTYAFWKNSADIKVHRIDLRQAVLDIAGQEIMTADKVTLRLNAVVTYQIVDALKGVLEAEDPRDALYREAQLVIREVIGARDLEVLLSDKDAVGRELQENLSANAEAFGMKLFSFGIRDIILPGEMKELMNKVIEAKKASEANLISRREETAAMRSQANTAKILESNPTLMRLRELEVLEKIAGSSNMKVVLSEKGLTDRVVNML